MSAPEYPIRLHRSALRAVSTFALLVAASPCWADPATTSAQGVEELPPVTVTAPATSAKADGSAAAGYRTEKADLGPLGDKKILDTPYSIVSVPRELMDAQQATQINDVVKYDPSAQIEPRGNLDFGRPQTRGFENASTQNTRIDGLNSYTIMSYPMEAFQSLEILNGAAGALYGASSAGGIFNFISKRATDAPLAEATLGYDANGLLTEHVEASGRLADGAIGYRLNALTENGQSYVVGSDVKRDLVSGNFDFHLGPHTKLELNAYYYLDDELGFPAAFVYGASPGKGLPYAPVLTANLPAAPDPTKPGYGVIGAGQTLQAAVADAKLIHEYSSDWKLTLGVLGQTLGRTENPTGSYGAADPGNWLTSGSGAYNVIVGDTGLRQNVDSYLANLNGRVTTGPITHDLVIATNGYEQVGYTRIGQNYLLGSSPIADPTVYSLPTYANRGAFYHSTTSGQAVAVLGDTISFNEHWQVLLAGSESFLTSRSFSAAGVQTADYNANGFSPTISLIYKPTSAITTYATYADALQQGDTAPTTAGITNPGAVLPPYRTKDYELGAKWLMPNNIELDTAAFRMSRPYAFLNPRENTFEAAGDQVNDGVEAMARGRLFDSLNVIGGVTYLDPKLDNTGVASTTNKLVVSVPRWQGNLYLENDIAAVRGLTFEANLHYTGERAANMQNTSWAAAYATLDLGARYVTKIGGHRLTWRVGVSNVTDARYWAAILPETVSGGSSQAGAANTVYAAFLGAPRVFHASLSAEF